MSVYFWNGKLLFRNGKLAKGPACCCTACDPLDYGLYPTGHGLTVVGDTELHWQSVCDTWCLCPAGSWQPCRIWNDCGVAKWLAPDYNCDALHPAQDFTAKLDFTVPDPPSTMWTFTGRVLADNAILWVKLNGTDLGVNCEPPNTLTDAQKCFTCWSEFLIGPSNAMVQGANTLEIQMRNYPYPGTSDPSPMGYAVFFECGDTRGQSRCDLPSSSTCDA